MTTIKQPLLFLLLAASFAIALAACNNAATSTAATTDTTKVDSTKADTTKAVAAKPPAMVVPFDAVEVRQVLKDFTSWKPKFDSNAPLRTAAGLDVMVIAQEIGKPDTVEVVLKISDMQKAKDFYNAPELKVRMAKGGVIGKPNIEFLHVMRFNSDSHEKTWVEISHKVKNFAAWLKIYDAEGPEKRKTEGMIDLALARGVIDSNMVNIVFDITDMDKAKAALASPDKKKLMMSAGVMGMPKIMFFKSVE